MSGARVSMRTEPQRNCRRPLGIGMRRVDVRERADDDTWGIPAIVL